MDRFFTWFASRISFVCGQPLAFVIAVGTIIVWGVTGPLFGFSDTWQLVINTGTTIVTFLMVFLIQNSTNRDAAAMQAKLDELLRAVETARPQFIGIEHLSEKQLEEIRTALEQETGGHSNRKAASPSDTVEKLLERY
ncbi:MAG TPA: low affinity iron permease family protein [Allosphingosinicella sp.]|nr:low affinity iron permease family protein [Allosphingosinicella sp.]